MLLPLINWKLNASTKSPRVVAWQWWDLNQSTSVTLTSTVTYGLPSLWCSCSYKKKAFSRKPKTSGSYFSFHTGLDHHLMYHDLKVHLHYAHQFLAPHRLETWWSLATGASAKHFLTQPERLYLGLNSAYIAPVLGWAHTALEMERLLVIWACLGRERLKFSLCSVSTRTYSSREEPWFLGADQSKRERFGKWAHIHIHTECELQSASTDADCVCWQIGAALTAAWKKHTLSTTRYSCGFAPVFLSPGLFTDHLYASDGLNTAAI